MKAYYERFGYLPTTCYADKICMNRENRALLKRYRIKAAGKLPGKLSKEMQTEVWQREAAKDEGKRNKAEFTFGTDKRIYRVNNARAKLSNTADVWTATCFFVKNVMKFFKGLFLSYSKRRCWRLRKYFLP